MIENTQIEEAAHIFLLIMCLLARVYFLTLIPFYFYFYNILFPRTSTSRIISAQRSRRPSVGIGIWRVFFLFLFLREAASLILSPICVEQLLYLSLYLCHSSSSESLLHVSGVILIFHFFFVGSYFKIRKKDKMRRTRGHLKQRQGNAMSAGCGAAVTCGMCFVLVRRGLACWLF